MNSVEFGIIIREIREKILNVSQEELASSVNSSQYLISRLERGMTTIHTAFIVLDHLNKLKINTHMIFFQPFNFSYLTD